jgi:hypothetical protein
MLSDNNFLQGREKKCLGSLSISPLKNGIEPRLNTHSSKGFNNLVYHFIFKTLYTYLRFIADFYTYIYTP